MSKKAKARRITQLLARSTRALQRQLRPRGQRLLSPRDTQTADTLEILSGERTAKAAYAVGRNVLEWVQDYIDVTRQSQRPPIACRAGCAWCCSIELAITPPEALLVAKFMRETFSRAQLTQTRARLQAGAAARAAQTRLEGLFHRVPCGLLDASGACSVYPARPLCCRGWHSASADACRAEFYAPNSLQIPVWRSGYDFTVQAMEGLKAGLALAGVDGTAYELQSAVLGALASPTAAREWAEGQSPFLDCTNLTRRPPL